MILELCMPICAFLFSLLLVIIYFSKKRIKLYENNMFASMIVCILIDSILVIIEKSLVIGKTLNEIPLFVKTLICTLNRFDACILILYTNCIFLYIFLVTTNVNNNKKIFKSAYKLSIIFDFVMFVLIFMLKSYLIESDPIISVGGSFLLPTYIACSIYITLSLLISLINFKNITKKNIPLFITIILSFVLMFIFTVNPYITIISIVLTFVNFIMYFTIENPDKKLLEEAHISKKIADAANEDKSMFIYNMMNDVKGVARDINKSSEEILNSDDIEENKYFARKIISSNNKLYSMANDIYNIDVIDDINVKTISNKYNIKVLLKEIVRKNKKLFEGKSINFRDSIDSNLPNTLYGDSINLKNVLNTILGNSYKYTDRGYVELSANAIFKKDIARLVIKIEDSGIGIRAEELDKCLNKNTKDQNSLYGARKIINMMGGNLLISSEYNKGTTVTIILDQKIGVDSDKDNYDSYVNNKKILIVDDDSSNIKLIGKILDKHNILYDSSTLGKEALDRIRKGDRYDLILLDEDMSYMNGISVMNKLSKIKGFDIKVILLTRNNSIKYDEGYKDSGFSDYIIKPIDKDDLMNKINKWL